MHVLNHFRNVISKFGMSLSVTLNTILKVGQVSLLSHIDQSVGLLS